ncbi:MAG: biotin--[acetyl-CoA-carboxylase] ligase [Wolbachia endosymbiont of Meromenopon meropis]|nr:biotin--[acetyl-CoA-carboxylase] ligase [Wolbachia endosymbiont of Meromenopon meropis]
MIFETFNGFCIYHYEEVSNTNRAALHLIDEKKISTEIVIIADKQTDGRGRDQKSWISPKGNFYASLIINLMYNNFDFIPTFYSRIELCNDRINLSKLTELTFVTSIAIGDTLSLFIDKSKIQYKWPNDILVDNKKISGILLKKKSNSSCLVIGIGININHAPLLEATCISRYGRSVSNMDLLKELILNFNKLRKQWTFKGFSPIREMWLKRGFKINEQISIKLAGKLYDGIFIDIDQSGRLVLKQKNGSLIYFHAGELFINSVL